MLKRNLQKLIEANKLVPCPLGVPQTLPQAGATGLLARSIRGLRHYLAASSRKQALEAEILKAIKHLHTLTDEQLRDIGITRMDISRAVRLGKDNI